MNTLIEWEIRTDFRRRAALGEMESVSALGIGSSMDLETQDDQARDVSVVGMSDHAEEPHIGLAMKTLVVVARLGMIPGVLLPDLGKNVVLFRPSRWPRQNWRRHRQDPKRLVFIWK
jgi:hypothetical protein